MNRSWRFLRILFPSWRFFEDIDWVPRLYVRTVLAGTVGEWIAADFPVEPRRLYALVWNPRENLRMAIQSLIEQFATDASDTPEGGESAFAQSVSYALVARYARAFLREAGLSSVHGKFQFLVVSVTPGDGEDDRSDPLFLSGECELAPDREISPEREA